MKGKKGGKGEKGGRYGLAKAGGEAISDLRFKI